MNRRIETIRRMLEKDPDDVFLHYSLAMEYVSAGLYDEAMDEFHICVRLDEAHLPARVEAGKCLRSAGRLSEAREAFLDALELALEKGESHTADFIRQQLEALGDA